MDAESSRTESLLDQRCEIDSLRANNPRHHLGVASPEQPSEFARQPAAVFQTTHWSVVVRAGDSTRIDLTLGIDADGDGLPDAWQALLRSLLGPGARVGPNDDADGDGISNLDEYLAGTYAFQPDSGFRLNLLPNAGGPPLLEFMVVGPRTYTVYNSTNLQTWTSIPFNIPASGPSATNLPNYRATGIHILQVEPILPPGSPLEGQFFKVKAQ